MEYMYFVITFVATGEIAVMRSLPGIAEVLSKHGEFQRVETLPEFTCKLVTHFA